MARFMAWARSTSARERAASAVVHSAAFVWPPRSTAAPGKIHPAAVVGRAPGNQNIGRCLDGRRRLRVAIGGQSARVPAAGRHRAEHAQAVPRPALDCRRPLPVHPRSVHMGPTDNGIILCSFAPRSAVVSHPSWLLSNSQISCRCATSLLRKLKCRNTPAMIASPLCQGAFDDRPDARKEVVVERRFLAGQRAP